jgi:hypothetical protein
MPPARLPSRRQTESRGECVAIGAIERIGGASDVAL